MKILVVGAAGNMGRRIVAEAQTRGHEVTAVMRNTAHFKVFDSGVTTRLGDAGKVEDMARLSLGHDVVVNATRPANGQESDIVPTTQALLDGLARTNTRLIVVGGAASLKVPDTGGKLVIESKIHLPIAARSVAQASLSQFNICSKENRIDWVYLCPPAQLIPGQRTGNYRLGCDELLLSPEGESTISMEDLAVAVVDEIEHPKHHQTRFTAAY